MAVQNLKSLPHHVEVDEADRVALEERVDDGGVLLAVTINVVALVLRLDDEPASEAKQTLTFELVVDEALDDLVDGVVLKVGLQETSFRRMKIRL